MIVSSKKMVCDLRQKLNQEKKGLLILAVVEVYMYLPAEPCNIFCLINDPSIYCRADAKAYLYILSSSGSTVYRKKEAKHVVVAINAGSSL